MTVLNYEFHENLADHHELLEKLKDFAVSEGWTATVFQQNVEWANLGGGTYGWDTGSETFLMLNSTGYGSQDLQFRFRGEADGGEPTHEWIQCYGYVGSTSLDTSVATHPVQQTTIGTRWSLSGSTSFPSQTIPKTWLFGNDKFLLVVCQVDNLFVKTLAFGSVELFDSSETEGNLFLHQDSSLPETAGNYWFNYNTLVVFDTATDDFLLFDGSKDDCRTSFTFNASNNHVNGAFYSYGQAVNRNNSVSARRPMYKQDYFALDSGDGRWVHLGKAWVYRIDTEGLEIGERVKYGSEEFLCFANGRVNERFKGFAVQIAS